MTTIGIEEFQRVDLRAGTVLTARPHPSSRRPAYLLEIDLGPELGVRTSSAQLTPDYEAHELVGRRVVVVANLPVRRVAGEDSEVLVLATVCPRTGTRLIGPEPGVPDGSHVA